MNDPTKPVGYAARLNDDSFWLGVWNDYKNAELVVSKNPNSKVIEVYGPDLLAAYEREKERADAFKALLDALVARQSTAPAKSVAAMCEDAAGKNLLMISEKAETEPAAPRKQVEAMRADAERATRVRCYSPCRMDAAREKEK